ncbi:ankyrin repeat domain-containing protein [Wolbachia endosymbiont of Oedothorax gibbosus]|uniref:ankyrin repeat domain-containing protein n=1 Tax=Wolbachia endosymbiont of Oedothorax gibbosus TaxID=931100 RepID=UPI00202443D2|nr:ankyrin repeat domain-containing protein [Wolbachia endosymbiont of Oedothorax gibbosus]
MIIKPKVQVWNKSSNKATTNKDQPKLTNDIIKHKNGLTPLYIAVKRGYVKVVKRPIKNRVNVKVQDKDAFFALLRETASRNILGVVKRLIKSGVGIEIKDQDGFTPLHIVAARNSEKAIKYLLENGAELEARDKNGCTPLHSAIMSGCAKGVKYLVESGANLEAQDKDGLDYLFLAKCSQNDKIIKLLEEKIKNKKDLSKGESEKMKSQHSQTNEVSLEKVGKRQFSPKVVYTSLAAMLVVGAALSIAFGLFVLLIVAASVVSALIAGGITYTISKPIAPDTELKEVDIQGSAQRCL